MYSDIIPPKKKYVRVHTEEYNSVRFTSSHPSYTQTKQTKKPIILFMTACVLLAIFAYHNLAHATKMTIEPKVTRFDIKQHIPLMLQGRQDAYLTYSLVYVSDTQDGASRNPFVLKNATSSVATTSTNETSSFEEVTLTASTTGKTKHVTLINKTSESVPLRKDTRFDVDGVVYALDSAVNVLPTEKKNLTSTHTTASSSVYRVIGFKGYPTYDSVYALDTSSDGSASEGVGGASTSTKTVVSVASSTVPPKELLSLMPPHTLALQKSTIYDKNIEQSALVVFDQSALEHFLQNYIPQTIEYYKALKPFGESIAYDIAIVDYSLQTSPETGKPVSFSSLTIEITPKIDTKFLVLQFAGFSRDTMTVIEKQIASYVHMETKYTPFWSKSVSSSENIHVDIQ